LDRGEGQNRENLKRDNIRTHRWGIEERREKQQSGKWEKKISMDVNWLNLTLTYL
jgi:hypothetical protein